MTELWQTTKGLPPETLAALAGLFVVWVLIDKVVGPLVKARLYQNGHDRRRRDADPEDISHRQLETRIGARIDKIGDTLHERITRVALEVSEIRGFLNMRRGAGDD